MLQLNDLSLKDITPPSLLNDSQIQALIYALDPELKDITRSIPEVSLLSRIDELDEPLLSLLAYQFHVDLYDLAGTLRMKREAVKNSLLLHMKKGTVWAIKEALRQLDIQAEYVPWWESGGKPYTFSLRAIVGGEFYRTSGRGALISNIYRAVNENKSARSLLVSLHTEIRDTQTSELYAGVAAVWGGDVWLYPDIPRQPDSLELYVGGAVARDGWQIVGLEHRDSSTGNVYAGVFMSANFGIELGVDLSTMHELLLRFEERIFARLDEQEQRYLAKIKEYTNDITERLDRVESLLKWAGDDEEL